MSSNNQIVIIGRVANDVMSDTKTVAQQKVTEVKLAVNRPSKDENGRMITDFISCKFWNRQADVLIEHVRKGDLLSVTGALRIDTWENNGEKRHKYYIHGEVFQMLSMRQPGREVI